MRNRTLVLVLTWIGLAAAARLLPHPPNVTPVAAMALFAGCYLPDRRWAYAAPLLAMLLTDLVLPQMSGSELANQLLEILPGLRVIFMSGYTESKLGPDAEFLQKPFTPAALCRKVREVLDKRQGTR